MIWQFSPENITIITYFIVFFFGILVCFTPCVYPIMPVIISYIGATDLKTKKEGFLRSLSYVCGLALVYSVLGAIAAITGGLFGVLQNNFWVNLIIANIFIIMGLVLLGVFHMPQVAFFQNLTFPKKSGLYGAFLIGAVSGFCVGPCTTPILGGILTFVAAKQNIFLGITLLFSYALGMGFPLLILGTFVGLLKKMPKSGNWMERVKKVFGLLLIATGEYFLLRMR